MVEEFEKVPTPAASSINKDEFWDIVENSGVTFPDTTELPVSETEVGKLIEYI